MEGDLTIADLYQEHKERLERYAMSLTHDPNRADDLVQETIVRAMTHFSLLRRLNAYQRRAWLYRVLRNRFFDEQRAHKRHQVLLNQLARQASFVRSQTVAGTLHELIDRVPQQYRNVLERRYVLGMTSAEIGRELGIPAATVRSRLHLAIKWLRRHQSKLI
jgi:RNA polymerase sigma-70 factor (ECF subfamily)